MQIAILIFDKLTALDAIGPYEVLRSVPGWEVKFVGPEKGQVRTDSGALGLSADYSLEEVSAADVVLVPGGEGNRPLISDDAVLSWLRQIDAGSKWTTSVCTGSLVLGAAGLLEGKRATCHWPFLEQLRQLRRRSGRRSLRRGRQAHHRRWRLGRDRHGAAPGRPGGRSGGRAGHPARASSTTRSRLSTPAHRPRHRRRSSSWSPRSPRRADEWTGGASDAPEARRAWSRELRGSRPGAGP